MTDTLETLLQIRGGALYIAEMTAAARGTGALATAQAAATATSEVLAGALALVGGRLAIITAAIAGVVGVVGLSVKAFGDANDVALRAAVVLRNMGSSLPIGELQQFASGLQRSTGINDEAIISAGALLARFRVAGTLIPDALRAIADTSALTKISVEELAQLFGRGLLPNGARALRTIGIQFTATGDRIKDTENLIKEFNKSAIGGGAARRNSPLGAFQAALNSIGDLFEALGRLFGPAILTNLNQFIIVIDAVTKKLNELADFLSRFGLASPATPKVPGGIVPGSAAALGGEEALDKLGQIAKNTEKINEEIIRQAFGGPGTIGRQAGTIRALRQAFGNSFGP